MRIKKKRLGCGLEWGIQKMGKCENICGKPNAQTGTKNQYCYISTEASNHSRRCFITGEYCSKQPRIQSQRGG